MDEILSIVACAVIGCLLSWFSERGKRGREDAERKASEAHDTHREHMRCPEVPLPHRQPSAPPMPEEGIRVSSSSPETPAMPHTATVASPQDPEAARRRRWRQAVIDAEILTRRY